MADTGSGAGRLCNDKCGCSIPCSGGSTCRCSGTEGALGHSTCSCGEHCGCNPCGCSKAVVAGAGCKCATGCTCSSCHT